MLLPTTFIRVWFTSRPDKPVNSVLVSAIAQFLLARGRRCNIARAEHILCLLRPRYLTRHTHFNERFHRFPRGFTALTSSLPPSSLPRPARCSRPSPSTI